MLTFYYHPLSPVARRVWIALLEKDITYQPVVVNLNGDQHKPEFLKLNPFHRVPVLVDDGFSIVESLAILDYLEKKFPTPSLLPDCPKALATMRMAQLVTVNEITTKFGSLTMKEWNPESFEKTIQHIDSALKFLEKQLGQSLYFGGDALTLGDVVVGTTLSLSCRLGVSLEKLPVLKGWFHRVTERKSWQTTEPSHADFETWKRWISLMVKRSHKRALK